MAIFRECKHSFQIVQALFGKSASTLVFFTSQHNAASDAKVRKLPQSLRTLFASARLRLSESNGKRAFRLPSVSRLDRRSRVKNTSKAS